MDNIGSMNSLRDDAATSVRGGKNANARRTDDQERGSAFGDLLANMVTPTIVAPQPVVQPEPPQVSEGSVGDNHQTTTTQLATSRAANATDQDDGAAAAQITQTTSEASGQAQSESDALLAQLTGVGVDQEVPTGATLAQTAPPSVTTNAATLSASRSNVGAAATQQSDAELAPSTDGALTPSGMAKPSSTPVSNDNAALIVQTKTKPVESEAGVKVASVVPEAVSTTLDGAGSTSVISGQEVAVPANDQANRAPQLTPQNIPMLAATMMRRLDSGAKQFTMRLDPPELGQVEVKLTVAADKKVRAVISADRPEALADLVRSARELARALSEAGLDLEDNGLTFQMNDPSNGGQNQQARDHQAVANAQAGSNITPSLEIETTAAVQKAQTPTDPFERWQRARIALTA